MVKKVGVAILGLGVVGGGTYETLVQHHDFYLKTQQVDITVEMILERDVERMRSLGVSEEMMAKNIQEVIANPNVDIVIETIGGIGVAKEFVTGSDMPLVEVAQTVGFDNYNYFSRLFKKHFGFSPSTEK